MERDPRGRSFADRHELRQHPGPGRLHLAARRLRRAARAGAPPRDAPRLTAASRDGEVPAGRPRRRGRAADALADVLRRLQALHTRGLPGRVPHRLPLPHRVRHGRRPGGHLQRLRLLRARLPVRRHRATPRRRPGVQVHDVLRPARRGAGTGLRQGMPDGLHPVRAAGGAAGAGRAAGRPAARGGRRRARLYGEDPDDGVGGDGAFFLLLDEPEVYGLPPGPVVTTRDLPAMWKHAGAAALPCSAAWPRPSPLPAGVAPRRRSRGDARTAQRRPQAHGLEQGGRRAGAGGASNSWCRVRSSARTTDGPILKAPSWAAPDIAGLLLPRRARGRRLGARRGRPADGRPRHWPRAMKLSSLRRVSLSTAALVHDLGRPSALRQHAAGLQADLAHERRLLAAFGLRPGRGRRRRTAVTGTAAPRWAPPPRQGRRCSGPRSPPTPRSSQPTPRCPPGTAPTANCPTSSPRRRRRRPPAWPWSSAQRTRAPRHAARRRSPRSPTTAANRCARRRLGMVAETYEQGRAGTLLEAAEIAHHRRCRGAARSASHRRPVAVGSGLALLAGSACARFGVFAAGVASAEDPKYTILPQRAQLDGAG